MEDIFPSRPASLDRRLVLLLCAIFLLAGSFGHDPWKTDDALGISIAQGFLDGGHWGSPSLAGEPWVKTQPLWHWVAALTAWATSFALPFHDGARLASVLFGGLFLVALGGTAGRFHGKEAIWGAPLLAIGTLGLIIPLHEAQPASAILASTAGVFFGLALWATRPIQGSLVAGGALGACFLAGGIEALLPAIVLLAWPIVRGEYRQASLAIGLSSLVAALWLVPLYLNDRPYLELWWEAQAATLSFRGGFTGNHLKFLAWVGWPVLYIALWALWRNRHQWRRPAILLPLGNLAFALAWFLSHEIRTSSTLAIIPPLVLLAAAGAPTLRRGAANAWDWFGMMTISLFIVLLWLGYSALLLGWPNKIAENAARLEPGYTGVFTVFSFLLAASAMMAWLVALTKTPRGPWRSAQRWAAGITCSWVILTALLMPWIDYGKTYRPVVADLKNALATSDDCIGRMYLGAPQRAALDYFGGIRTRWGNKTCPWLIMQGGATAETPDGWTKVWEGHRPGDRSEWLRLYRRLGE